MWQGARVYKNWFFHPLHWPWPVIGAIFGLYLTFTGVVYLLHKKEQNDKSHDLYYHALDIRKRELANLKLSGTEPFVWKPLFACKSLEQEGVKDPLQGTPVKPELNKTPVKTPTNAPGKEASPAPASADRSGGESSGTDGMASNESANESSNESSECIRTAFAFSAPGEKQGYHPGPDGGVLYTGHIAQPCLICHPKNEGQTVTWSFHYPYVAPQTTATVIWTSDDFLWFHLAFWLLLVSYGAARVLNRKSGLGDHVAAAIRIDSDEALDEWLGSREGKRFYRCFFYAEQGPQYLRGYIPRNRFEALMKKMTSGAIPVEPASIRIGVVEYGSGDLSFEGLRVAQALANKAPAGTLVIEENILPQAQDAGALKKAVWKKGSTPVYFRIVQL